MIMRCLIFLFCFLAATTVGFSWDLQTKPPKEERTYCHDPEAWAQWTRMVYKYPGDPTIQSLHALWLGLCMKIEMGQITTAEAIDLFEQARKAAIEAKTPHQKKKVF